jgi:cold shock protein
MVAPTGQPAWPLLRPWPRQGTVEDFDEGRGLGTVVDDDGGRYPFHCTALVDGTRSVAVGARVVFTPAPGHLGRLEGRELQKLG